uniref:Uncharacterized protein n=1 Tax=Arundo donax TaxID=35708 RepID=A0A0A8Z6A4_ARUDO
MLCSQVDISTNILF